MSPIKWVLIKDDKSHWHYDQVIEPDPEPQCCEFMNEVRECLDCSKDGGPDDGLPVRWHAAFNCPFCRGPGVPVNGSQDLEPDPSIESQESTWQSES